MRLVENQFIQIIHSKKANKDQQKEIRLFKNSG